ncbi:MAG: RNA polymerase sigma factor [Candidatus Rifleibacteriota bacterium]
MNDHEAIKLAIQKREDGYKAIFENHSAFLFTHALKFMKNRECAEDLVQETFNDAFRFLEGFKGNSSLRTWLYKILYNKALRSLSKIRHQNLEFEPGKNDESFKKTEQKLATKEILDKLPEKDRSILLLAYWDELKLEEIAEILEISLSNAKVSLFRARKRFERIWLESGLKGEMANEM